MKVQYFAGLAKHLLANCEHPNIRSVEPWIEPAGQGTEWPRFVLRVELVDGTALMVAFTKQSSPDEVKDGPDLFQEGDLERIERQVPSMLRDHVGR